MKNDWLPFEDARAFAHTMGFRNKAEWEDYCQLGTKPKNIPTGPAQVYQDQWQSWGDWLGTGFIATSKREYLPFEQAREYVRGLGLKSQSEWGNYLKSGQKPNAIPSHPREVYAKQWLGFGDWLGTRTIAPRNIKYRHFEQARAYARGLGLKSKQEWNDLCRSGNKPDDIPSKPDSTIKYKDQWQSWGDWLGTGFIATLERTYLPFEEAREFVRKLDIRSVYEWRIYCQSVNKPEHIPAAPDHCYREQWRGFGDWLGTDTIANFNRVFLPFEEARAFARWLGLSSLREWQAYSMSGKRPTGIPSNPAGSYREQWQGWGDWLGTGMVSSRDRVYLPFEEARAFVLSLGLKNHLEWCDYCRTGNKPDNIPSNPVVVYKDKWRSWNDWLRASKRLQTTIEQAVAQELERRGEGYIKQHRIGRYVADFWIADRNLLIECQGCYWHHCPQCGYSPPKNPQAREHDRLRTQYLEKQGYRVACLWEHTILANVKDAVDSALTQLL